MHTRNSQIASAALQSMYVRKTTLLRVLLCAPVEILLEEQTWNSYYTAVLRVIVCPCRNIAGTTKAPPRPPRPLPPPPAPLYAGVLYAVLYMPLMFFFHFGFLFYHTLVIQNSYAKIHLRGSLEFKKNIGFLFCINCVLL
jgi:hypothetical protein